MYSCIICLTRTNNKYYNLCNICNNFIICHNCYQDRQTQTLQICCNCRHPLHKSFHYSWNTLWIMFIHYRLFIIHILGNLALSNITLLNYFPYNRNIQHSYPQNITMALFLNNYFNIIIIPLILNQYKYYVNTVYIYAGINLLFFIIFISIQPQHYLQIYYIYIMVYFYILNIFKFTIFSIHGLLKLANIHTKLLYIDNNINTINIHNTYNIRSNNLNQITTF
jgi:hypothetical protein